MWFKDLNHGCLDSDVTRSLALQDLYGPGYAHTITILR